MWYKCVYIIRTSHTITQYTHTTSFVLFTGRGAAKGETRLGTGEQVGSGRRAGAVPGGGPAIGLGPDANRWGYGTHEGG
jgi:hypothetical protein